MPDLCIVAGIKASHVQELERSLGIGASDDNRLCIYVVATWVDNVEEGRRSRSGIMMKYGDTPSY